MGFGASFAGAAVALVALRRASLARAGVISRVVWAVVGALDATGLGVAGTGL